MISILQAVIMGFVAKYYYELAQDYYKHRWGFAFLGAGLYLTSNVIFGLLAAIFLFPIYGFELYRGSTMIIAPILFSLFVCLMVYLQLNKIWKRKERAVPDEIDQIGKNNNEPLN